MNTRITTRLKTILILVFDLKKYKLFSIVYRNDDGDLIESLIIDSSVKNIKKRFPGVIDISKIKIDLNKHAVIIDNFIEDNQDKVKGFRVMFYNTVTDTPEICELIGTSKRSFFNLFTKENQPTVIGYYEPTYKELINYFFGDI